MLKKIGEAVNFISDKTVKIIMLCILAVFVFHSARYTYRLDYDYMSDIVYRFEISPVKQVLFGIWIMAFFYCSGKVFLRKDEESNKKTMRELSIFCVTAVGIVLSVYVAFTHIPPHWDQLQVYYYAQDFIKGNFEGMQYAYLRICTHQYGIIFLESLLLRIVNNYIFLQYINVLLIMLIIYMIYMISDELFQNQTISLYSLLGITMFLPMHLYVNYVYGDISAIAATLTAVWAALKFSKSFKWKYLFVSCASGIISMLSRKNALIPIIAIFIFCLLEAFKSAEKKYLIFGAATLCISLLSTGAVTAYYNTVSGYKVSEGIPITAWIVMGLEDDGCGGIGLYSGYNEAVWNAAGGDRKQVEADVSDRLNDRLDELLSDKKEAYKFFEYKIFEQWDEASFSSINETGKGINEKEGLIAFVYSDSISDYIYRFMTHYIFVIYLGAFVFSAITVAKENKASDLILFISVIGCFLFSIVWEAKGKYVMPGVIYMIPYMAAGLHYILKNAEKITYCLYERMTEEVT